MYHLIVNPVAGHGAPARVLRRVETELAARALPYRVYYTDRPGHACELARGIAQAEPDARVVSLGGDGTLCEVAGGLCGSGAVLVIVPCGTGNDFVRTLKLPAEPLEALRAQLSGRVRAIDCGEINGRCFLNVSGTGFDIEVLLQADRFKSRFRGLAAYMLGLIAALRRFRPVPAALIIDGKRLEGAYTIIEVANGQYIGGGMRTAPGADLRDGLFDVVYVEALSRLQILRFLPKFIAGRHLQLPTVHVRRAREVRIEAENMILNVDGELLPVPGAHYRILPGQVNICM